MDINRQRLCWIMRACFIVISISIFAGPSMGEMISVPAGSFEMGDPFNEGARDERPVHTVTLSAYEIGKYEVTNTEYADVLDWALANGRLDEPPHAARAFGQQLLDVGDLDCQISYADGRFMVESRDGCSMAEHPVVEVSWYGAAAYCNWLSEIRGLQPCYDTSTWKCDFTQNGYHLPTEAQWERAAAWDGSRHLRYSNGRDSIDATSANYDDHNPLRLSTFPYTSPVGYYNGATGTCDSRSPIGCYDMSGNVWEWCNDRYGSSYYASSRDTDPKGPDSGWLRVLRGGSWNLDAAFCRSARRFGSLPAFSYFPFGFRIARTNTDVSQESSSVEDIKAVQYRVTELSFSSESQYERPLTDVKMEVLFKAPNGTVMAVPAFWDGGRTWRVRFAPTEPGGWSYTTRSIPNDAGLDGQTGKLFAEKAHGDNSLHRHGGFLRVSADGHYLTYTDGTPFFWLGDTWWCCPSNLMPFETCYKKCIDTRRKQGYSAVQMCFIDWWSSDQSLWSTGGFKDFPTTETLDPKYWQNADRYIEYANGAGIVPVFGLDFSSAMDRLTLEQWQVVWRHVVARYGAYAVTFLITGEYNIENQGDTQARVAKVLSLGSFIKDLDPYKRAMTVHPISTGKRQAWKEDWHDFVMLQGGHGPEPPPYSLYLDIYKMAPAKPVVEGECRFEGLLGFRTDDVREVAYRAIQAGAFGYTYGSQGLWYPTQDENDMSTWDLFGETLVWNDALERAGGAQMGHLRTLYESVDWWKLEPRPHAVETDAEPHELRRVLTKAEGDTVFIIYFPRQLPADTKSWLTEVNTGSAYSATWFDPRTGQKERIKEALSVRDGRLRLPGRVDRQDWLLILRKE